MSRRVLALMCVAVLAATGAVADDGAKVMKKLTGPESITPEVVLDGHPPLAEHAFTGFMPFYVTMQASNGEIPPIAIDYYNVDGEWVETREYAKPLVNVFIYGPAIEPDGTAFAHSFMDTYGAVSLDDGMTWKKTNLSQSANTSSFNLVADHVPAGSEPLPADHNILLGSQNNGAFHAAGYDVPYTAHCTECHGRGLTGTSIAPSCYSCHLSRWKEEPFEGVGPIVYEAIYKNEKLVGSGENADPYPEVDIINGFSGDVLFTENVTLTGTFSFVFRPTGLPPCTVAATVGDTPGASIQVTDKDGVPLGGDECQGSDVDLTDYPGGAYNVFHSVVGNRVLVAWPSRFCQEGQPAYSIAFKDDDEELSEDQLARRDAIADLLGVEVNTDLYLTDLFGVGGPQRSIDFADEGYPQAGVVPFGCVWTARGQLVQGDDPRTTEVVEESYMRWFNAERLTSGRRDPNRIEVQGVEGAGFVITWQEDPDGLRPGQGLGPGEGWSGAVAHDKTDVWYSFIPWEHFDVVQDPADETGATSMTFADYETAATGDITQKPKPFVPMAVPMRLTNNNKCNPEEYGPGATPTDELAFNYCNEVYATDYGLQDFCAALVSIPLGPLGELQPICVNEDGLPNIANTAATRPRLSLQGYSSQNDDVIDSAWVIVAAEESKGLGRYQFLPDGTPCDETAEDASPDCGADIGKNQWYFSFDMGDPATSATASDQYGLVQNLVNQGNMLNQPEVDWRTGEFYPVINTLDMWDFGTYNFDLYNTEIARRASLLVQGIAKAESSSSGLLAMPSYKQGAMRQGGPADTMLRRIILPDGYIEGIANNPYAFTNMACDSWLVDPGDNPYYPDGLCGDPATNLSSVIPDTCLDDEFGTEIACPAVDFTSSTYGIGDTNPILQGYIQHEGNTTRVLTWHQCPSEGTQIAGDFDAVTCDTDDRTDDFVNLKDQSWYNPLDVSKGHRGFLDGDFVMFLYAWSPNWRLNTKGSDRYDLYIRRSFDGGATWGTTPSSFNASNGETYSGDGTVTCETYRSTETQTPGAPEPKVCYQFGAGGAEHARNVTQHKAMRITTLDPRYATTGSPRGISITADPFGIGVPNYGDSEDVRDPSRYFIVFETGDNTTVEAGEAEPLDLFYSRAVNFGDDYQVWAEETDLSVCYPNDPHELLEEDDPRVGSGFCNEFDQAEQGTPGLEASEGSLAANPGGEFLYGAWAQILHDVDTGEFIESDAVARRVWWIDDYIPIEDAWSLPGVNQPE